MLSVWVPSEPYLPSASNLQIVGFSRKRWPTWAEGGGEEEGCWMRRGRGCQGGVGGGFGVVAEWVVVCGRSCCSIQCTRVCTSLCLLHSPLWCSATLVVGDGAVQHQKPVQKYHQWATRLSPLLCRCFNGRTLSACCSQYPAMPHLPSPIPS